MDQRSLKKKIRAIKGTFHARMSMLKDRNGKDSTEAEAKEEVARMHRRTVKKKKGLNDPNNYDGMVIHLEPDVLE